MHRRRTTARLTPLALAVSAALLFAGSPATAGATAATPTSTHTAARIAGSGIDFAARSHLASLWQSSQLRHGRMPGFAPGFPDWGLTVDVAFMLAAEGSQRAVLDEVGTAIRHHILDYAVYQGDTASGAMAKVLLVSEVLGGDPRHWGGMNLRKRVLKLVAPPSAGFEAGRLRDTGSTDYSNVFGQSYGTIGLARSGGVPQDVVDYLLKQRCSAGYFHIFETAGQTCDDTGDDPDIDATALALQALIAAKANGASVSHQVIAQTTDWLIDAQNPDGSYAEDAGDGLRSANSTGLAANALFAAGHNGPRLKAAAWIARMQITKAKADGGPAKKDVGAIATNLVALRKALSDGLGDDRSQWWRVAPQAAYALVPGPLGTLTAP